MNALGDYANGSGVKVLMETHGDLTHSDDLVKVISAVESPNTGLVWDIANMWSVTKEPPAAVYEKLKKYIFHTHIKDAKLSEGKYEHKFMGR